MRIDLHVHSNNSDGSYPPAVVVDHARRAGLDGIALTDHDSMAGLPEAVAAGEQLGVTVLAGAEISATIDGQPVHMLGYFMDPEHPRLAAELGAIRDNRLHRARLMVEKLNDLGVAITYDRVRQLAAGESVGRPHVAHAMVEAGVIATTNDAFTDEWIGNNGRAYLEKTALSPQGAVDLIRESGGVAVIAHPIWLKAKSITTEELIRVLAAGGLGGLEVDHPDHDDDARARFGALAKELDLIPTGSSDYHGNEHGSIIGLNVTDDQRVQWLRDRAKGA